MALTYLQRRVCLLLAEERKRSGESYVAGGAALNECLRGRRVSRDVDLFHDTAEAVAATWAKDRDLLLAAGLTVTLRRQDLAGFVEAEVADGDDRAVVQWAYDSAYRFFPLVEHEVFGLTLHPVDLATNKTLALVGRRAVRDWVDVVHCHEYLQPLGYLAWAAAGKNLGFGPLDIIEEAARTTRYAKPELAGVVYEGTAPDFDAIAHSWRKAIAEAREIVRLLPAEHAGKVVLDPDDQLAKASPMALAREIEKGQVAFHEGRIRGALPEVWRERGREPTR
jgi:hypothetical protein